MCLEVFMANTLLCAGSRAIGTFFRHLFFIFYQLTHLFSLLYNLYYLIQPWISHTHGRFSHTYPSPHCWPISSAICSVTILCTCSSRQLMYPFSCLIRFLKVIHLACSVKTNYSFRWPLGFRVNFWNGIGLLHLW